MSVLSCSTIGGVGRCVVVDGEDVEDVGGGEDEADGTEPITMGIQTEGGKEEINEVDWAAVVFAASVILSGWVGASDDCIFGFGVVFANETMLVPEFGGGCCDK